MRTAKLLAATLSVFSIGADGGGCCGVGGPEIATLTVVDECSYLACPVAIGGEATAIAIWPEGASIVDATLDADIADLALVDGSVRVVGRTVGAGQLALVLDDGTAITLPISTGVRATTRVVSTDPMHGNPYPPGRPQMFAGSTLPVVAHHLDDRGKPLLGHGFEAWSVTGGRLVESPMFDPLVYSYVRPDPALSRDVVADAGASSVEVRAAATGDALQLDVVPEGSTARLDISNKGLGTLTANQLSLYKWQSAVFDVRAYGADGRYIHGIPPAAPLSATVADPVIATATVDPRARTVSVLANTTGTTEVVIAFDGHTRRYLVEVF